jgi:dipeptidyl aminopeptidase/acylaminoacyl peptidase
VDTSVDACVSFYGVYDFTGSGADRRNNRSLLHLLQRSVFSATMAADPEAYRAASPLLRVNSNAPAFLVVHGADDSLVPVAEARRFVAALRAVATQPVCYAELPGTQHAFDVLPSVRSAHAVAGAVRFLQAVRRQVAPADALRWRPVPPGAPPPRVRWLRRPR